MIVATVAVSALAGGFLLGMLYGTKIKTEVLAEIAKLRADLNLRP
jgi:hypothetical protein